MGNEQYSKATRETAENLRIIDDAMFRLVAERKEVCQEILRTLLDKPQLKVIRVTPQCTITSLHREIILDVLCILKNGAYMNIEMQKGSGDDDIRRCRFNMASVTAAYTPKGTDFADVPQVTILYITEYDALHNGRTITHIKRYMETNNGLAPVDDGEDIFFANTVVKDGSDKSELLQLFLRNDSFEDTKFPELSKAVKYFKETEGGLGKMCKTVEDYAEERAKISREEGRSEGLAEGRSEGLAEGRLEAIRKMLGSGVSRDMILSMDYSEAELQAVEKELLTQV